MLWKIVIQFDNLISDSSFKIYICCRDNFEINLSILDEIMNSTEMASCLLPEIAIEPRNIEHIYNLYQLSIFRMLISQSSLLY